MQSLWMLAASFFFALMGMFVKLASAQHNLGEIVLFRGLPSMLFIAAYAYHQGFSMFGRHIDIHARRNISGMGSMWLGFYATTQLPLGTASTLIYTSPLFIALAMLYRTYFPGILRQQWLRFGAIVLGFVGVLMIFNPFAHNAFQPFALLCALAAGFFAATAYMTVKALGQLGEPEWRTVLLFSCSVVITGSVGVLVLGWSTFTWLSTAKLIGIGVAGMGGQLCMTRAFSRGSTTLTATLQYAGILFSSIIGYYLWDDRLSALAWLGMALVVISGLAATIYVRQNPVTALKG